MCMGPSYPGLCSIVSHPPKITAGWGSLCRDGAWASLRRTAAARRSWGTSPSLSSVLSSVPEFLSGQPPTQF